MIILITGATHSGKTRMAQKMLEAFGIPYLCQDHLKMGLIRSGFADASPEDPGEKLTGILWPVTREIIKTAVENRQDLIIEGCYFPFDWKKDLGAEYIGDIRFICICLSQSYIERNFDDIIAFSSCIERRIDDGYCTKELLLRKNAAYLEGCRKEGLPCLLIERDYVKETEDWLSLAEKNMKVQHER